MENIFDRRISCYRDKKDTTGAAITLRQFLFSNRHMAEIERLRKEKNEDERRRLKQLLPMATISGLFSYRDKQHLIEHSGLICIDIDGKDNPCVDMEQLKNDLKRFKEIAYCGVSVGGKGLFCIVPIAYTNKHEAHFLSLQSDFEKMGITIDAQCKDITRTRYVSFDPAPYINESAETYAQLKTIPIQRHTQSYEYIADNDTKRKVYELCKTIDKYNLDITNGYENWFEIGASLANLGEDGREAFHIVSSKNGKYNEMETDKKFDNFLRTITRYTIATFLYICKDYGLYDL